MGGTIPFCHSIQNWKTVFVTYYNDKFIILSMIKHFKTGVEL